MYNSRSSFKRSFSSFHPGSGFNGTNGGMQTTAAVQYVGQQETRLDLADLEKDVQKYFENGLAGTTRRTYQSGINKFVHFCNIYHVTSPLPVSQSLLCSYISHLANSGLAYSTIKTYLAAVRYLQISNDLPEPRAVPMPKLSLVERGIRRTRSEESSCRPRLPVTPTILRQLRSLWSREASDYDVILMWAACCTAFFGFFRMGEITEQSVAGCRGVTVKDVAVDDHESPSVIRIHLRRSKTDQFGRGVDVYLGSTGDELCPVAALLAYLAVRGGEDGPLFRFRDCRALTREVFVDKVRSALSILGYDASSYAGHSFRIGVATTAAEQGIEDSVIKMLGRWESSAYQLYVRTSWETLASISRRLVQDS